MKTFSYKPISAFRDILLHDSRFFSLDDFFYKIMKISKIDFNHCEQYLNDPMTKNKNIYHFWNQKRVYFKNKISFFRWNSVLDDFFCYWTSARTFASPFIYMKRVKLRKRQSRFFTIFWRFLLVICNWITI